MNGWIRRKHLLLTISNSKLLSKKFGIPASTGRHCQVQEKIRYIKERLDNDNITINITI